jgi:PEGA domain-containing protein
MGCPDQGPGPPVVLIDFDADPATKRLRGRVAAVAVCLLVALAGGAVWLGSSSIPASPARRELVASASPRASSDTSVPSRPDPESPPSAISPPTRTTRPTVAPRAPVAKRPAPPPPRPPARVERPRLEPGLLSVNAVPWGSVYLDGQPIGNTPQSDRTVAPGRHRLRVEREGYRPYDRVIDVASGQRLRITDITLVER